VIEGHCDERGTRQYNIQLGKNRARAVKKFLKSLGIEDSRMCSVSKGKEEPAVSNASSEEQHQKNRRAHFRFADNCP
jgi:peptidoglycan-associated lipoprotein